MMAKLVFVVFATLSCVLLASANEVDTYDFLMPNVWPHRDHVIAQPCLDGTYADMFAWRAIIQGLKSKRVPKQLITCKDELYLCTPIRISPHSNYYIVGFEPNATMHTAHHMLLYGCSEPGSNESVWSCGEMQSNEVDDMYNTASPCRSGSQIVYAWARDAPSLHLPKDVGFLIGKDSPIKYLVLQVHYMHRFPEDKLDNSGVFLKYTKEPMRRRAGVILLGTSGVIPPRRVEHMETACTINENKVIHPFAFRTHTHALGKLVSGYVVRQDESGDVWTLLGKKDPQLPQMFYPVVNTKPIERDDVLAARCIMNNTNEHPVRIGATNKDEMCNFYLMYWVENDSPLEQKYCFSAGPPYYYWNRARENLLNIPLSEI